MEKMHKKNKGITLVALVVTITVLLIISGISIATFRENGIIDQAKKARYETRKAEANEKVEIEVIKSIGIDGFIDEEELNKYLKNVKGLTYKGYQLSNSNKITSLPVTVQVDNFDIEIDNDGEITIADSKVTPGENKPTLEPSPLDWITTENEDGTVNIEGIDFTNKYKDGTISDASRYGYNAIWYEITVDFDTLIIPSEINGKKVIKVDLDFGSSKKGDYVIAGADIYGIKKIIYGDYVEWIYNNDNNLGAHFLDVETIQLPNTVKYIDDHGWRYREEDLELIIDFPNGINSELEIPDGRWRANKIIVNGVEQ